LYLYFSVLLLGVIGFLLIRFDRFCFLLDSFGLFWFGFLFFSFDRF